MRRAKIDDHWRRLAKVGWFESHSYSFESDGTGLPDVTISRPVTLLAGLNGSSKSRLLAALEERLGDDGRLIQLHALSEWIRLTFARRPDLINLSEETEPLALEDTVQQSVREIVRRDYSEILWYAFPASDSSDGEPSPFPALVGEEVMPYFEVEHAGVRYGAEDMGLGELSVHILLWLMWYMREFSGTILLDEPDAFVPASSASSLLHEILRASFSRQQSFIIATHGNELISQAVEQESSLICLHHDGSKVVCYDTPQDVANFASALLGVRSGDRTTIFVEDDAAAALTRELLIRIDRNLLNHCSVLWTRGLSSLEALRSELPRVDGSGSQFLIVVDGERADMIDDGEPGATGGPRRWPISALPGGAEPDVVLRDGAKANPSDLAVLLRMSEPQLAGVLAKLEGTELHTWTESLVEEIPQIDRASILAALAQVACGSESGASMVEEFKTRLAATRIGTFATLID